MRAPNRTVEAQRVRLYDGTEITRITGKERRRFLVFPYTVVTICYVPREADVLRVVNSYRANGEYFPPGFECMTPPHRCMAVEKTGGVVAVCACGDWRQFVPFDRHDDSGQCLRKALNAHMAHAERMQADTAALRVIK